MSLPLCTILWLIIYFYNIVIPWSHPISSLIKRDRLGGVCSLLKLVRNQVNYMGAAKTLEAAVLEEAHAHLLCVASSPSGGVSF